MEITIVTTQPKRKNQLDVKKHRSDPENTGCNTGLIKSQSTPWD